MIRRWTLGLLGLLFALGVSAQANALTLSLVAGSVGAPVVITDGSIIPLAFDSNPLAGAITFIATPGGPFGLGANFVVNVTTGISKPILPGASMDLNSVHVDVFGVDTLTILLSDAGFPATGPGVLLNSVGGTLSGPAGSFVVFQSWKDPGAVADVVLPGAAGGITAGPLGPFGTGPFSGTNSIGHGPLGGYTMSQSAFINMTGPGAVSFNFETKNNPVPEPATMLLLGSGLVACGLIRRRRKTA